MAKTFTPAQTRVAINNAVHAMNAVKTGKPTMGACRCYVYLEFAKNSTFHKMAAESGIRVLPKMSGAKSRLYVGYDNFTGVEVAKAEALADALVKEGFDAYFDYDLD